MKSTSIQSVATTLGAARSLAAVVAVLAAGMANAGNTVLASADSSFSTSPQACGARQPLSGLDARVVAKAAEGVDSLRNFIAVSKGVYGLDMESTVAWLDRQRSTEAACQLALATPRR